MISRRLIVNADDFGRSDSINEAIIAAHRDGILTSASLMMNESASESAVKLARENPRLGVGLHLTLLCGHSAVSREHIPGLVNRQGEFSDRPATTGFRYFFKRKLQDQFRREIDAQFARFAATGLALDHVNGHLHMHMHPVVFRILIDNASRYGIRRMRFTRDRFWLNAGIASGNWWYRILHAAVYQVLSTAERRRFQRSGFRFTNQVFGLMQDSRVDESFVLKLLPRLPAGDSELYSHPSLDKFKHEFDALVSPRVKQRVKELGIELIRYQDL